MKKYRVNWGSGDIFIVPDVAEEHLRLASGKAAKVLLEIMKYKDISDINRICQNTGVPEEDVEDALSFWYQVGVLSVSDNKTVSSINTGVIASSNNKEKTTQALSYEDQIRQVLGIERVLNEKERSFIQKWEKNDITLEEISSAAEKTRRMTGKTSFAYMDKIFEK
ncbi:MAG: hypothetical protein J5992_09195 [Oscillospiraceae bacterium]|nr:hypothetical protein [Oscillospiraceae bacterium]